jgi:putative molybdopterin biosynthesis protein
VFRKLLTLDEAWLVIREHVPVEPLGVEAVPLLRASGRVLAENVVARLDVPCFDRSTVDGYAVRAEDTFEADENRPVRLRVSGVAGVGRLPRAVVKVGCAVETVTGAPIPEGADAVVMLEDTERDGAVVLVRSAVVGGENVMRAGSDVRRGETVLRKGAVLGSGEVGVLAAVGLSRVKVFAAPRVAVFSTGGEVVKPGGRLSAGKVYDTNAYSLSAAVNECGGRPVFLGVLPDRADKIERTLRRALACADVVVTSGGVSVGPKDLMPAVLGSFGKPGVVVCGVAIKPGKPVTVAVVGRKPVFSLPGHPASALLVFRLLVEPVLRGMGGRKAAESLVVKALAGVRMFSARGRRTFVMVRLKRDRQKGLVAEPFGSGLSGAITTLAGADGFVEIGENVQFVDAGEEVSVRLLRSLVV